jgi:hypothetical protein
MFGDLQNEKIRHGQAHAMEEQQGQKTSSHNGGQAGWQDLAYAGIRSSSIKIPQILIK